MIPAALQLMRQVASVYFLIIAKQGQMMIRNIVDDGKPTATVYWLIALVNRPTRELSVVNSSLFFRRDNFTRIARYLFQARRVNCYLINSTVSIAISAVISNPPRAVSFDFLGRRFN